MWIGGAIGLEERGDDPVTLLVGFADEGAANAAAAAEQQAVVEFVDEDTWADEWRAFATPTRIGELLVQPAWVPLADDHGARVVITIDPGRVFGHGAHASTVLALDALWGEPLDGAFVLDLGTGSGVLAVAAVKRGAARVIATDIDPDALEVCEANARRNGVASQVLALAAPLDAFTVTFDTVVANILAVTLRELAADIIGVVVPGGSIVLSGMLDEQLDGVVDVFTRVGCSLRAVHHRDGWAAAVFDRDDPEAPLDDADALDEDWFTDGGADRWA